MLNTAKIVAIAASHSKGIIDVTSVELRLHLTENNYTRADQDNDDLSLSRTFVVGDTAGDAIVEAIETSSRSINSVILPAGKTLDHKYRILALLGEGGMGAVYLAHHIQLDKKVALKTFRTAALSDESWERFRREAQAIGRLEHRNIVRVFDFGVAGNVPYYTMELLEGESLSERLARKGALPAAEVIEIFLQLCSALATAHKRGIIHRDIKPGNIFLEYSSTVSDTISTVKLVDFGVAALAHDDGQQKLTAAGAVFGSPLYMSPEQAAGRKADARSDIYSCGCTLFEALTGQPPFRGANAFATIMLHQQVDPESLATTGGRDFPFWLEGLTAAMLAKDPDDRLQNLQEVIDVIEENVRGKKSKKLREKIPLRSQSANRDQSRLDSKNIGSYSLSQSHNFTSGAAVVAVIAIVIIFAAGFICAAMFYAASKHADRGVSKVESAVEPKADSIESGTRGNNSSPVNSFTSFSSEVTPDAAIILAAAAKEARPFLATVQADGTREFHFPSESIGTLVWGSKNTKIDAKGTVLVPPGAQLTLFAGEPLYQFPQLFLRFSAQDLNVLTLDNAVRNRWNDERLFYIRHLTSLQILNAEDGTFSKKGIDYLNGLTLLSELDLSESHMEGDDLLILKRLPQLTELALGGVTISKEVLKKLTAENRLVCLELIDCDIDDSDVDLITKIHSLRKLNLNSNKITDKALELIADRLPNLTDFRAQECPAITSKSMSNLLKLRKLTDLGMPQTFWNNERYRTVRHALPDCDLKTIRTQ